MNTLQSEPLIIANAGGMVHEAILNLRRDLTPIEHQSLVSTYMEMVRNGGSRSGNFGHPGRPGQVGGSGETGSSGSGDSVTFGKVGVGQLGSHFPILPKEFHTLPTEKLQHPVTKTLLTALKNAEKPAPYLHQLLGSASGGQTVESQKAASEGVYKVLRSMPTKMLDQMYLTRVVFHEDSDKLTDSVGGIIQAIKPTSAAGAYMPATGELHTSGINDPKDEWSRGGVLAHELMHAVDIHAYIPGVGAHSLNPQWKEAAAKEIMPMPNGIARLTDYARTHPAEGFAEFGRLVHGSDEGHSNIAQKFPLCTKYFKDKGLWTDHERAAPPSRPKPRGAFPSGGPVGKGGVRRQSKLSDEERAKRETARAEGAKQWAKEGTGNAAAKQMLLELFNHREEGPSGSHTDCWVEPTTYNVIGYNGIVPLDLSLNMDTKEDGVWRTISGAPVYIKGGNFYPGGPGSKPVEKGDLFPKSVPGKGFKTKLPSIPHKPFKAPLPAKVETPKDPNAFRVEHGVKDIKGRDVPPPSRLMTKEDRIREAGKEDVQSKMLRAAGTAALEKGKDLLNTLSESSVAKFGKAAGAGVKKVMGEMWEHTPTPLKAAMTAVAKIGLAIDHQFEGARSSVQAFAKGIAHETAPDKVWKNPPGQLGKPQLLPADANDKDDHAERLGRMLTNVDGVTRYTTNVVSTHAVLTHLVGIGGPVAIAGAKLGYYIPVASLAFTGAKIAGAVLTGSNPFKLISNARSRAREYLSREQPTPPAGKNPFPGLSKTPKDVGPGKVTTVVSPSKAILGGGTKTHNTTQLVVHGGPRSGNFGHPGRPGQVGGSGSSAEAFHEDVQSKLIRAAGTKLVQRGQDIVKAINKSFAAKWMEKAGKKLEEVMGDAWKKTPAPLRGVLTVGAKLGKFLDRKLGHLRTNVQEFAKGIAHETAPAKVWKNPPGELGQPKLLPTSANDKDDHAERIGRILASIDAVTRVTSRIPMGDKVIGALLGIGGPVVMVAAKMGYYFPIASTAYIGAKLAGTTLTGGNPFKLITNARAMAKEYLHRDRLEEAKKGPPKTSHDTGVKTGTRTDRGTTRIGKGPHSMSVPTPRGGMRKIHNANPNHDEKGQFSSGPGGARHTTLIDDATIAQKKYDKLYTELKKEHGSNTKRWPQEARARFDKVAKEADATRHLAEEAKHVWDHLKKGGFTKDDIHDYLSSQPGDVIDQYDYNPENPAHNAEGDNCGTGAGGFQPGNSCGKGGDGGSTGPIGRAAEWAKRMMGVKSDPPELHSTGLPSGKQLETAPRQGFGGGSKANFTVKLGNQTYFVKQAGLPSDRVGRGKGEIVASEVSRLAGLDHPPVKSVILGDREYVVSPLLTSKSILKHNEEGTLRQEVAKIPKSEISKALLADYAMGFGDTQGGNYLVGNGKITHIDKEYAFNTNPMVKNYKMSEMHVLLRVATGHDVQQGVLKVGSDSPAQIAERKAYQFPKEEIHGMIQRIPAMAQRLRDHGMHDSATHMEHRGEVLRQLSQSSNPTVGHLEQLHAGHGKAAY